MRIVSGFEPDGSVGIKCDPFHGGRSLPDWLLGHSNAPECLKSVAICFRNFFRESRLQQPPLSNGTGIILACLAVQPFAEIMEPGDAYSRDFGGV